MNLATLIVGLIVALIVVWCVAGIVRSRKKGKCSCGCENCNGCMNPTQRSQRIRLMEDTERITDGNKQ